MTPSAHSQPAVAASPQPVAACPALERSGGGAATFWIAAADERVKVCVPVSGMSDLQSYVTDKVCKMADGGPALYAREAFGPAAGFVVADHRTLGWGSMLVSPEGLSRAQQALVELAPDARYRFDHVRVSRRGYFAEAAQVGTRASGAFESSFLQVVALADDGRPLRMDVYDVEIGRAHV